MRIVSWRVGRLNGKALMLCIISILFIFLSYWGVHDNRNKVISIDICSGDLSNKVNLTDKNIVNEIYKKIMEADISTGNYKIQGKYRAVLNKKNGNQLFLFDNPGILFEPRTGRLYKLADKGACLTPYLKRLKDQSPYGEFLKWDEAKNILKKFDTAKIVDVETRMAFMIQRRAGSKHADVQPITAKDTDIMKKIYGGKWSWKRRAVIVETAGWRIAGSMNGMPHGAGAIRGNKFNGHFCIHFRESRLHNGGIDKAHQLMVWKAAGVVGEMVDSMAADGVVRVMMTALEQGDYKLASKFVKTSPDLSEAVIANKLKDIEWVALSKILRDKKDPEIVDVILTYKLSNGSQFKNRRIRFKLERVSGIWPWKIEPGGVMEMFRKTSLNKTDNDPADFI